METKQDYQIINGEKWPLFPLYVMNKDTGLVIKAIAFAESQNAFFSDTGNYVKYKNAILVNITEAPHERAVPQKYVPWTHEDVGSLLFFKDKIFRGICDFSVQLTICEYAIHKENYILVKICGYEWKSFETLLNNFEYSTDGTTWHPCGKLVS